MIKESDLIKTYPHKNLYHIEDILFSAVNGLITTKFMKHIGDGKFKLLIKGEYKNNKRM